MTKASLIVLPAKFCSKNDVPQDGHAGTTLFRTPRMAAASGAWLEAGTFSSHSVPGGRSKRCCCVPPWARHSRSGMRRQDSGLARCDQSEMQTGDADCRTMDAAGSVP